MISAHKPKMLSMQSEILGLVHYWYMYMYMYVCDCECAKRFMQNNNCFA